MPTLDGYQTSTKIRTMMHYEHIPHVLIICVSGNSNQESREEAYKSGMNHFLLKPVEW